MIIITRDTTEDQWIKHRLYDTETGIRYSFEISQKEGYAPQYDNIAHPVHLTIEHPASPKSDEFKPTIVYPGIEAIDFLRQFIKHDIVLQDPILHMIDEALHHHQEYYEEIPESRAALERLQSSGRYTLNFWHPVEEDSSTWIHYRQVTDLKLNQREYYTGEELITTVTLDTHRPLSEYPSFYPVITAMGTETHVRGKRIPGGGR